MNPGENQTPEIHTPSSCGTPPPNPLPPNLPARIQWSAAFRLASPLAIVTGVTSALFSPITLLLVLPISLKRIIARYRPFHSALLRTGQGAAIGAFTALLSFIAYLVIMLPVIAASRGTLLEIVRKNGGPNPDPQLAQWYATNEGFVVSVAFAMVVVLAVFLIAGAISGAVIAKGKNPPVTP